MTNQKWTRVMFLALIVIMIAGCSKGGQPAATTETDKNAPVESKEPITITIYNGMGEDLFIQSYTEPVRKKYPNITVQQMKPQKGVSLQDMVSSGNLPDIFDGDIDNLNQLQLAEDLTPLLKKNNISLSIFDDRVEDAINKQFYYDGKLLGVPVTTNVATLLYNKDIFDKFGVAYPKDGMTWPQTIELAKKLTVLENGVQYRGLDIQLGSVMNRNQLSLPVVDQKTLKASVNNEGWTKWFQTMKTIFEINGNQADPKNTGADGFLNKRTIAMYVTTTLFSSLPTAEKNGLKWDSITIPTFSEQPNTMIQPTLGTLSLYTKSPNKEVAFKVIAHIISEEGQLAGTRAGRMGVLKNQEINTHFGEGVDVLKGKNGTSFYKNKFAPLAVSNTRFDGSAYAILQAKFSLVISNKEDINTALREAEEEINKKIETDNIK